MQLLGVKLGTLIAPRLSFAARCMEDIEKEIGRFKPINKAGKNYRVSARNASNKPFLVGTHSLLGKYWRKRMVHPFPPKLE